MLNVKEQANVGIIMPDGCRLSARIWMPDNALNTPVPAIVEHLPYRKRDGTIHRDEISHPYVAGHGYACIRVDMRGNGESEGLMHDEYTAQELQDACDVLSWAASQPWCNGNTGMIGISWGGFNSLQVAALQPPSLKAIVTVCSTVDRFADDIHYKGGCLLTENIAWAATMLSYSSRPPDPALVRDQWQSLWLERLNNMPFLASTWLRHQKRDAYWQHGSVCEDYSAIKAAVLSVGGWHDGYRNTISHLVSNVSSTVKGIVGPWIHKYPHYAAPKPAIGFLQETLRWWDYWLKGIDTDVKNDPAYRVWLMDSVKPERWLPERPGRWVGERNWPSKNIKDIVWQVMGEQNEVSLALVQNRVKSLSDKASKLNVDATNDTDTLKPCDFTVASSQICGANCGEYFPFTYGPELPDEQSEDDALSLCVDGETLEAGLNIIGAPTLDITLSSDQTSGHLIARLCDLRPDGTSALVTMGVLNLKHRDSFENPSDLTPGETFTTQLVMDQIAYHVPAGHRLRLALSTSYWPFIWPSVHACCLSVSACSIALPIKTIEDEQHVEFEEPQTSAPWRTEELRAASSEREVYQDDSSGALVTLITNDFGAVRDLEHGLISGSKVTERWGICADDPLSATAEIEWEQNGGRDEWEWRTVVEMRVRCDAHSLFVEGVLQVLNDGEVLFEREFGDVVGREFV